MTDRIVEEDGKKMVIVKPNRKAIQDAQIEYNKALRVAVESGAYLRKQLYKKLEQEGVWTNDHEKKQKAIIDKIGELETTIRKGGLTLTQLKDTGIEVKKQRNALRELIADRNSEDLLTAESQAENSRFYSLIVSCILDENKNRLFSSIEDYESKSEEKWALAGVEALAEMLYQIDPDYEKKYVENRFLAKYKIIDDDGYFLNKEGQRVDYEGRLVNSEGFFIEIVDGVEHRVDKHGNRVDENGDFLDALPMLDDDGNPIVLEEEEEKPKKRGRPKKDE